MNSEQLYYFELAYIHGNFSAAARMVPVSHQGLTKGIRSLERELGVTLFTSDAETGKPVPTPYACELYEFVAAFNNNLRLLNDAFERLRADESYTVRLGCSLGVLGAYGPSLIDSFVSANPNIHVPYWESNDALCEEGILSGKYDIALCISPLTKGCVGKPLYESPLYFWMKADAPAAIRAGAGDGALHPQDLCGRDIAIPGTGFKCFAHLNEYAAKNGIELGRVFEMSEIFQLYGYVLAGRGLGFCNGTLVDLPVFQGNDELAAYPVEGLTWGFGIERLSTHVLSEAEHLLWNWCCAAARELPGNTLV